MEIINFNQWLYSKMMKWTDQFSQSFITVIFILMISKHTPRITASPIQCIYHNVVPSEDSDMNLEYLTFSPETFIRLPSYKPLLRPRNFHEKWTEAIFKNKFIASVNCNTANYVCLFCLLYGIWITSFFTP